MRDIRLPAAIAGAIVAGGAAVVLLLGAGATLAASPSAPASPAASSTTSSTSSSPPTTVHPNGHIEAVSDASVEAKAIGITEAQLDAAVASGQTVAAVAKAHNVDPQKVIDALVTDGLDELAAQVKAGTLTQAQADAQKAAVTQRATDQVNGTFTGGRGGPGGACPAGAAGTTGATQ